MKTKVFLIIILIICALPGCVKEFQPKTNNYDDLLVVDGAITNEKGPYTITLSKSTKIIQFSSLKLYSKCKVEIMDNIGNKEELKETSAGIYKTDSLNGIQGIIGRKYKIKITTPESERYESTEEEIKKPIGIQAVYPELQHKNDPELFYGRDGYQFYVNTEKPATDTNCYLWVLEKTYKFKTDFPISSYYNADLKIKPFYPPDSLRLCYKHENILEVFVLSTANKSQTQTTRIPLNYEDNYTKALTIRYSLNVKQYTLTESTYKYWETIKKITDKQGELYTQQPYQAKNNIINLTNSDKPALGYFMAAGVATKRIFTDALPIAYRYPICPLPPAPQPPLPIDSYRWPIYLYYGKYFSDQGCVDCTVSGFLKKPDYWID
ncbi:MAG: DUF4249 domain-containing protein [Bacteroidia bacterium]